MSNISGSNNQLTIKSPVRGEMVSLESVPDLMFSEKVIGDGVAFRFDGNTIYSPCDGVIKAIARTKHAIGIRGEFGIEILLHVGLQTTKLDGKGFEMIVKEGQKVKASDPLIKLNRNFFEEKSIDLITPMIITNNKSRLTISKSTNVDLNDTVLVVEIRESL